MAFTSNKKPETGNYETLTIQEQASRSFFAKTMRVEGEITSDEDITIEGNVKGKLNVSKTVTIGKDGYVNGDITASVVRINGEAEGKINASEKLEIFSNGKYSGAIKSDKLVVSEGAKLKAFINVDEKKQEAAPEPEKPAKKDNKKEEKAKEIKKIEEAVEVEEVKEVEKVEETEEEEDKKPITETPSEEQEEDDKEPVYDGTVE